MKIRTRITRDGIIQERIFETPTEPGPPASISIEIPGYTQSGDEIGTGEGGGGEGGGATEEQVALLEAYAGAGSLANSVGRVTLTLTPVGMDLLDFVGTYFTIHDVGNDRAQHTIEFVDSPGDPPTQPGAHTVAVGGKSLDQVRDALIDSINIGDSIFPPRAWSLVADPGDAYNQIIIRYTGQDGSSGGVTAVDDSMDVLFEEALTFPFALLGFDKRSLQDTTLDGRLSLVDPGDGCIIVPLTTIAGGTWSARYPIHPLGITITGMSMYTPSSWASGGKVILDVKKNNFFGDRLIGDYAAAIFEFGVGDWGPEDHGWVLKGPSISGNFTAAPLRTTPIFLNAINENLVLDEDPKPSIYVSITAPGGTSSPPNGHAKLFIHYRVNP